MIKPLSNARHITKVKEATCAEKQEPSQIPRHPKQNTDTLHKEEQLLTVETTADMFLQISLIVIS